MQCVHRVDIPNVDRIGMKQITIDTDYLHKLLLDYEEEAEQCKQHGETSKQLINLRNNIVELLLPVTRVILQHYRQPLDMDMLQESFEWVVKAIRRWSSERSNYEKADIAYFNRCIRNFAINYCKKQGNKDEKEVSVDILDSEIFDMLGTEDMEHKSLDHEWNPYEESLMAEAYSCALHSIMGAGLDHSSTTDLRKQLQNKFDLSQSSADEAIDQAEVTLREVFVDAIPLNEIKFREFLTQCKLFERMIPYIEDGDMEGLVKVFGGMTIKIPKGV